ncbi:HAD family hydrolase [Gaiella sp.]|uniref:HAD family hydrolase n=1 Tax=Gaiella sp. TaxID=2663207 RepID=UPI00398339A5
MDTSSDCPWRLVVSDMDGTLVTGTTACTHLGAWIGHAAIEDLEERFVRGGISDREVAEDYAPFYKGIALADAVEVMSRISSIDDIGLGVAMLRQRSVEAFIATVSWSFAARALADLWGFSQVCGADLELARASGLFTGRVSRHFEPEEKVAFVAEHCRRAGIGMEQVVAIGDGRSDLPLFKAVGFSVALNASSDARAAASIAVEEASFLAALHAVPDLLG